jgi:predicted HicB family RNase H-like nuclease
VATGLQAPDQNLPKVTLRMDGELRKKLKAVAALEGFSVQEWLYALVCRELNQRSITYDLSPPTG